MSDFDLIICGQFAIDGDTAQTGPSIATHLNIPQVTYVKNLYRCDGHCIYADREIEDGIETVKVELPALICVLKGQYEPNRPTINGVKKAQKTEIITYTMADIAIDAENTGIKGSPTYVSKAFRPKSSRDVCKFCDSCEDLVEKIKVYGGFCE
jgi:electron transfer flavoprotein beta subunit